MALLRSSQPAAHACPKSKRYLSASGQELFDAGTPPAQTCLSSQFRRSRSVTLVSTRRRPPLQTRPERNLCSHTSRGHRLAVGSRPSTRCQTRVASPLLVESSPMFGRSCVLVPQTALALWLCCAVRGRMLNGACAHGRVLLCVHLRRGLRCPALKCARARVLVPDSESCRWFIFAPCANRALTMRASTNTNTAWYHLGGSSAPAQSSSLQPTPFCPSLGSLPPRRPMAPAHTLVLPVNTTTHYVPQLWEGFLHQCNFRRTHAFTRTRKRCWPLQSLALLSATGVALLNLSLWHVGTMVPAGILSTCLATLSVPRIVLPRANMFRRVWPQEGYAAIHIEKMYENIETHCNNRKHIRIIAGDFNAQLGPGTESERDYVGEHRKGHSNKRGSG